MYVVHACSIEWQSTAGKRKNHGLIPDIKQSNSFPTSIEGSRSGRSGHHAKPKTHLRLVRKLRSSGAITPLPHMRAQEHFYHYLFFKCGVFYDAFSTSENTASNFSISANVEVQLTLKESAIT
jgi:hypothetical protein